MMFLFRKIRNTILRHAEFVSASHDVETLKRVQGDIKTVHKTFCHAEFGSESRDVETKKRVQGDKILKKALAFTLAETLIVMGIIGVVAALTIPNLNSSTAEKEKVAKVKKVYSNLLDALGRAEAVYGPEDEWYTSSMNNNTKIVKRAERITEFMKIQKNCGVYDGGSTNVCFPFVRNGDSILFKAGDYSLTTADGTAILFSPQEIMIDIDGSNKGRNKLGEDVFSFLIGGTQNGLHFGMESGESGNLVEYIWQLTDWVITNGNMDYLKATYSGGTYTCSNGNVLNWETNTSCK